MSVIEKLKKLEVISESHPPHYLLHKYWGRKPHNLVSEYIKVFTKPGDVVLDPFMGSGGAIIESNKLGRLGIGVDLNPMACFIVSETLKELPSTIELRRTMENIINNIPKEVIDLTMTRGENNEQYKIDNAIWKDEQIIKIKYYSNNHRVLKEADKNDRLNVEKAKKLLKKYEKAGTISYPKDEIMQYVRRNGKNYIYELFSPRNLLIASFIIKGIRDIKDQSIKESLLLVFTSALPNFSSMIPGDEKSVTGKSGWQISKFWVPGIHTEKNVIDSIELRLGKYIKGKEDIEPLITNAKYYIYNQSCENMSNIKSGSIDYIFTDPPYGDSISYFALSSFWSTWLDHIVDYDGEIIYDPYRNKKEQDYSLRLDKAFNEIHRTLKNDGYMSFTFHNRHVKFWKIIIDAVMKAGFELIDVKWIDQAVASGTQGINRDNTLTGDFVYSFKKIQKTNFANCNNNGEEYIMKTIKRLVAKYSVVPTSKLYEELIPILVRNQAYYDSQGKILNIDKFIRLKYKYSVQKDGKYGWTL